jgi:hypothetical protein
VDFGQQPLGEWNVKGRALLSAGDNLDTHTWLTTQGGWTEQQQSIKWPIRTQETEPDLKRFFKGGSSEHSLLHFKT